MLGTILLVLLILMLLGAWPTWPHSKSWGYYPSGGLGLVAVIEAIAVGRVEPTTTVFSAQRLHELSVTK